MHGKHFGFLLAFLCIATALLLRSASAAETPPSPPPQKIQELLTLLRDPTVADWLTAEVKSKAEREAARPEPTLQLRLEEMLQAGRKRVTAVQSGFALLGHDFATSRTQIATELLAEPGFSRGWQLIVAFIGLGLGSLWLAIALTGRAWQQLSERPIGSVHDRLNVMLGRLQIACIRMLAFTIGSLGLFLLFDWPPVVRTLSIGILAAAQGLVGSAILGNLALAPMRTPGRDLSELRLLPLDESEARSWFARMLALGGLLSFAIIAPGLLERLEWNPASAAAVNLILVLALAAAALEAVWSGYGRHRLVLSIVIVALLLFCAAWIEFSVLADKRSSPLSH